MNLFENQDNAAFESTFTDTNHKIFVAMCTSSAFDELVYSTIHGSIYNANCFVYDESHEPLSKIPLQQPSKKHKNR